MHRYSPAIRILGVVLGLTVIGFTVGMVVLSSALEVPPSARVRRLISGL